MNLKPGVPKRVLLLIAAIVWTFASVMLFIKGGQMILYARFPLLWALYISIPLGLLFYLLIFSRISLKHFARIFKLKIDKPSAFDFFSVKGYLLMIVMTGAFVFLRITGSVDPLLAGVFYWIMGIPLFLSSFRYWYFGFNYHTFETQYQQLQANPQLQCPRWQKRLSSIVSIGLVLITLLVAFANYQISHISEQFIYSSDTEIPDNAVAVVPGTSKRLASGQENLFFTYRLQAVADLYQKGKIRSIIVSGDNGSIHYNEPMTMKKALIRLHIPDSVIYLDCAGFRTFDSVIRAWRIFGQKKFTFVSQRFQNERAVFIGRNYGIDIIAYNAMDVSNYSSFKTMVRELFARVKVMLDIYVLNQQPRFLGDPVTIK